jgi:hypothetical protein
VISVLVHTRTTPTFFEPGYGNAETQKRLALLNKVLDKISEKDKGDASHTFCYWLAWASNTAKRTWFSGVENNLRRLIKWIKSK